MLTELTELIGLEVYTNSGYLVGNVTDVILDSDSHKVESVFIHRPNPMIVEGSVSVAIPYRWVSDVGDIMVLRYFPKYVRTGKGDMVPEEPQQLTEEEDAPEEAKGGKHRLWKKK